MSIVRAFETAFSDAERKGWDYIYVFVDLHSTVIKPNYTAGNIPSEFYIGALEALKMMSDTDDMKLVMYTCSHPHEIEKYIKLFEEHNIIFNYVNENPEVTTTPQGYGCYDMKPYFNVMLEDKAGFYPEEDWEPVNNYLRLRYDVGSPDAWFKGLLINIKTNPNFKEDTMIRSISAIDIDMWNEEFPEANFYNSSLDRKEFFSRIKIASTKGMLSCDPWKPFIDTIIEIQKTKPRLG